MTGVKGQESPSVDQEQKSPIPIINPPIRAMIIPAAVYLEMGSFKKKGENAATHNGVVVTRTTELATLVYSSEVIQAAKCTDRKNPDNKRRTRVFEEIFLISLRYLNRTGGKINNVAKANRKKAMVREGASSCANLMKIDAVETDNIPNPKIKIGLILGDINSASSMVEVNNFLSAKLYMLVIQYTPLSGGLVSNTI